MFKIILNGREVEVSQQELSYDEIVKLVKGTADVLYTITYGRADQPRPEGSVCRGQSCRVKAGTVICCVFTGNA